MKKVAGGTLERALFILGVKKPEDEESQLHIEYVEYNRCLVNLRRSMYLSGVLILVLFVLWFMPEMIPGFDYYVPALILGSIVALIIYVYTARYIYNRLLKSGKSPQEMINYRALIILFWSVYYIALLVVLNLFKSNIVECMGVWLALMVAGLTSMIFDKIEALFIIPISLIGTFIFIIYIEISPLMIIVCAPLVLFFFLMVQFTNFERLENYFATSSLMEEGSVSKRRLGNIFEKVYDFAFEINMTTGVCEMIKTNELYGISNKDNGINMSVLFERAIEVSHPDDKYIFAKNLNFDFLNSELMRGTNQLYFEGRIMNSDGEYNWVSVMFTRSAVQNEVQYVLCLVQDIDERKNREVKLRLEAEKDPLTQLYNKTTTRSLIEECLEKNSSSQHALLIIDIDNFKTINDTRGHAVGDQILLAFSAELNKNFRETDILGRAGGDEFVVLIKNVNSVAMVCDKLQRFTSSFKKYGIENGFPGRLSCSIGVSMFNKDGKTFEELFKRADAALYEAKRNGKDQYKFSITRS